MIDVLLTRLRQSSITLEYSRRRNASSIHEIQSLQLEASLDCRFLQYLLLSVRFEALLPLKFRQ